MKDGNIRVVNGSFIADATTLTVPDYVFEDGYDLRSLSDVASYVKKEHHLPDVPGRAELKANGLDHSKFQMQMLRKVEELTLYTIDQDRALRSLEQRLTAQTELLAQVLARRELCDVPSSIRARLTR